MTEFYKTISDYPTANGSMAFWYSIRDSVPFAYAGILLTIFIILFAGNYFIIKSRTGRPKIMISLIASSMTVMILSLLLALANLISYIGVMFWAFMSIVCFIIALVSDNN